MTNHRGNGARTKPSAKGGARANGQDAIALLKADHTEARHALKELSETTERARAKRTTLLAEVGPALWIHMQIEEDVFYPAFERAGAKADDEVLSFEARAEHQSAKAALARLEDCDPASTEFRALAKVVHDLIEHHASEEEKEMFPRVRALMTKEQLQELGATMAETKEQLRRQESFRRDEDATTHAQPMPARSEQAAAS